MSDSARKELPITIRPAALDEPHLYDEHFSPNSRARHHHRRFAAQKQGEGIYLIAWYGDEPVGHFLLRWQGPDTDPSQQYPKGTPYLEGGATKPAYQRRGIGTRMIQEAERLAMERGHTQIGTAVGSGLRYMSHPVIVQCA